MHAANLLLPPCQFIRRFGIFRFTDFAIYASIYILMSRYIVKSMHLEKPKCLIYNLKWREYKAKNSLVWNDLIKIKHIYLKGREDQ